MRVAAPHIGVEPCAGAKTDVMGFPRVVVECLLAFFFLLVALLRFFALFSLGGGGHLLFLFALDGWFEGSLGILSLHLHLTRCFCFLAASAKIIQRAGMACHPFRYPRPVIQSVFGASSCVVERVAGAPLLLNRLCAR